MKKSLCLCLTLLFHYSSLPQKLNFEDGKAGFQWGVSIKSDIQLSYGKPTIRIGLGSGLGIYAIPSIVYTSLHLDIIAYNNGLGSPKPGLQKPNLLSDFILSGTFTGGCKNRFKAFSEGTTSFKNYSLYYFGDFSRPPLQNPFDYSLSVGSNLIFNPSRKTKFQRVGFTNLHVLPVQISYYNDGTPFRKNLGDGYDRYYTGGGVVSINGSPHAFVNLLTVSYHKFTGYQKDAFEIANALDFNYVLYNDTTQYKYNKSQFSFCIGSTSNNWMLGAIDLNNTKSDIQHKIHKTIFNGYHRVPDPQYFTPVISFISSKNLIQIK